MLDKVSAGENNPLLDVQLGTQSVRDVNRQAAQESSAVSSSLQELQDGANISDEARTRFEREKEALKFSRMAQRLQEPETNMDRVSLLKDMVNSGRINEYLRTINNEELAQKLLDSPFGNFLR
jgi:hypothetical protein